MKFESRYNVGTKVYILSEAVLYEGRINKIYVESASYYQMNFGRKLDDNEKQRIIYHIHYGPSPSSITVMEDYINTNHSEVWDINDNILNAKVFTSKTELFRNLSDKVVKTG